MSRRVATLLAMLALAGVFLAAAVPKIADPAAFALAVYHHQLAPAWAVNALAIYLPWIELVAALALFLPRWRAGAALVLLAMLVMFTAAIGINLQRGLNIACGCFSTAADADPMGAWNLVRNGALSALTIAVWFTDGRASRLPVSAGSPAESPRT